MDDLQVNLSQPTEDDSSTTSGSDIEQFMTDLLDRLRSESEKNQLQLVQELAGKGEAGFQVLMQILLERQGQPTGPLEGKVYQILVSADLPQVHDFLQAHFPDGLVTLRSQRSIDYSEVQTLLAKQDFFAADKLTLEKMCELAGEQALQRRWLYFTEVEQFPIEDLHTLDTLWRVYSEGKFGFSVQRELWLGTGKNWEKLWPLIGWKSGNAWPRYPGGFTWDLSAPRGHLPLNNQLRGVRAFASLLTHPAWEA